nr:MULTISPECIES: helix-turn-helix domain-containing protein [unclassified Methylobacterium]
MDIEKLSSTTCPIAHGLARVGDIWSMLVLRNASAGQTRFDQFRASLGIAPNILSRRLKALTDAGLLEKRRYSERPPRDEYVLSVSGRDFLPVLFALGEWERRHHVGGPLSRIVDAKTGKEVTAVVVDAQTGERFADRPTRLLRPSDRTVSAIDAASTPAPASRPR